MEPKNQRQEHLCLDLLLIAIPYSLQLVCIDLLFKNKIFYFIQINGNKLVKLLLSL